MATTYFKAPTSNFFSTTLNGAINSTATTVTLNSTTNLQAPGYVIIDRQDGSGNNTPDLREFISFTSINGSDLVGVTRGADNSTARSHNDGSLVEATPTVGLWNDMLNEVEKATGNWVTESDAATITFDVSVRSKQRVTLAGNRTLAISGVNDGQVFVIKLTQDGAGSRTVTWFTTINWAGGEPTLTTTGGKSDVFGFMQTGTDTYDGFVIGQNLD